MTKNSARRAWAEAFYRRLGEVIRGAGRSERDVSIAVGLSPSGLRKMRETTADPRFSTIARLADELDVPLAKLLGISPDTNAGALAYRIAALPELERERVLAVLQALIDTIEERGD